ncbi:hypothetical protein GW17_00053651 [Ensete ventricosum]|nr:hypothetical protein GW17_00053651 [Ensete ventricosum]
MRRGPTTVEVKARYDGVKACYNETLSPLQGNRELIAMEKRLAMARVIVRYSGTLSSIWQERRSSMMGIKTPCGKVGCESQRNQDTFRFTSRTPEKPRPLKSNTKSTFSKQHLEIASTRTSPILTITGDCHVGFLDNGITTRGIICG